MSLFVGNPPMVVIALMAFFVLVTIPFRAVMAWTYNRTGSLFFVGFLHAASNGTGGGSGFGDGFLPRLYPGEDFVGVMHNIAFALIGIALIAATRGWLGLPTRRAAGPGQHADSASDQPLRRGSPPRRRR